MPLDKGPRLFDCFLKYLKGKYCKVFACYNLLLQQNCNHIFKYASYYKFHAFSKLYPDEGTELYYVMVSASKES